MSRKVNIMRRRWLWLALVTLLVTAAFGAYLWFTTPHFDLSDETLALITFDMDESQVSSLVGGVPTSDGVTSPNGRKCITAEARTRDSFFQEQIVVGKTVWIEPSLKRRAVAWREWATDGKALAIGFAADGEAVTIMVLTYTETLWEKIKRRLRLT
jgi:hypothetical protein